MITKTIMICGKPVQFKASATIPRLYRTRFQRDIFRDLTKLETSVQNSSQEASTLEIDDLEIFENVAYIMAWHADHSIPDNIDDWLDQFDMFSIYEVLPEILAMWGQNLQTDVTAKKAPAEANGR